MPGDLLEDAAARCQPPAALGLVEDEAAGSWPASISTDASSGA
jgi:hypothetical protein